MRSLITFMNTFAGRVLRIVLGLALIAWGWFLSGGTTAGIILGLVGLLPIVMGLWGPCVRELAAREPTPRHT